MQIFQPSNNKAIHNLNKIFGSIAILCLIAAVYLTLSQHPITHQINKFQAKILGNGEFFPMLTMGLIFIPIMLILLPIKLLLVKIFTKKAPAKDDSNIKN